MKLLAVVCAALVLTGCTRAIDATAIPEPRTVDCDLIFPGPGGA